MNNRIFFNFISADRAYIEPVEDMKLDDGTVVPARRLGYRITRRFVRRYLGRIFDNPETVFDESMLRPETQDSSAFADGVQYIMEAYERVAKTYFEDGSIEEACPPLKILLHIMAHGNYEGRDETDPDIRRMFTREALLESDWYQQRLATQQKRETAMWQGHVDSLQSYLSVQDDLESGFRKMLQSRLEYAKSQLEHVQSSDYLSNLVGTTGATPIEMP